MYISIEMRLHLISIHLATMDDIKNIMERINEIIISQIETDDIRIFIYIGMITNGIKKEIAF